MIAQTDGRRLHLKVSQPLTKPVRTSASPHGLSLRRHRNRCHSGAIGERLSGIQFEPQTKVADRDMCAIVGINAHHLRTGIKPPDVSKCRAHAQAVSSPKARVMNLNPPGSQWRADPGEKYSEGWTSGEAGHSNIQRWARLRCSVRGYRAYVVATSNLVQFINGHANLELT